MVLDLKHIKDNGSRLTGDKGSAPPSEVDEFASRRR